MKIAVKNLLVKNSVKEILFNLILAVMLILFLYIQGDKTMVILIFLIGMMAYMGYILLSMKRFINVIDRTFSSNPMYCVIDSMIITDSKIIDCSKKHKIMKIDDIEMIVYLDSVLNKTKKKLSIIKKEQIINVKLQNEEDAQLLTDVLYTMNNGIYLNHIGYEEKRSFKELIKIDESRK